MSALAGRVLALDATLREDDGQALAVELPARSWRELVGMARPKRWPLALVACGKQKRAAGVHRARDLYTGQLFQKAAAVAERLADRWLILSARYGVIHPEREVEVYEDRLSREKAGVWGGQAAEAITMALPTLGAEVLCLAGLDYREPILTHVRPYRRCEGGYEPAFSLFAPLEGLGIGEQLAALNSMLAKEAA